MVSKDSQYDLGIVVVRVDGADIWRQRVPKEEKKTRLRITESYPKKTAADVTKSLNLAFCGRRAL